MSTRKGSKRIEHINVSHRGTAYRVPLYRTCGAKPGPTLMLTAGQHGNEWAGIEVIRRLFGRLEPRCLSGRVLALPAVNTRAVKQGTPHYLFGKSARLQESKDHPYNLGRGWPGSADGDVLDRLRAAIWQRVVLKSEVVVDFHCYSRNNRRSVSVPTLELIDFAKVLDFGWVVDTSRRAVDTGFAHQVWASGRKVLTVEFVGNEEVIEAEVASGLAAVDNLLRHLGMLPGRPRYSKKQYLFEPGRTENILIDSPADGLAVNQKAVMEPVRKGDVLCEIFDIEEGRVRRVVRSPIDGVVTYRRYRMVVSRGDLVVAVADLAQV